MGCCNVLTNPKDQLEQINETRKTHMLNSTIPIKLNNELNKDHVDYFCNLFLKKKEFPTGIEFKTNIMDKELLNALHKDSKGEIMRIRCDRGRLTRTSSGGIYSMINKVQTSIMELHADFVFNDDDNRPQGWSWYIPLETEIIKFSLTIIQKQKQMEGSTSNNNYNTRDCYVYTSRSNITTKQILDESFRKSQFLVPNLN